MSALLKLSHYESVLNNVFVEVKGHVIYVQLNGSGKRYPINYFEESRFFQCDIIEADI